MTSHEKSRPLPKFGEWDVNNPASADGFTAIFSKASGEKKASGAATDAAATSPPQPPPTSDDEPQPHECMETRKKTWLCCF